MWQTLSMDHAYPLGTQHLMCAEPMIPTRLHLPRCLQLSLSDAASSSLHRVVRKCWGSSLSQAAAHSCFIQPRDKVCCPTSHAFWGTGPQVSTALPFSIMQDLFARLPFLVHFPSPLPVAEFLPQSLLWGTRHPPFPWAK